MSSPWGALSLPSRCLAYFPPLMPLKLLHIETSSLSHRYHKTSPISLHLLGSFGWLVGRCMSCNSPLSSTYSSPHPLPVQSPHQMYQQMQHYFVCRTSKACLSCHTSRYSASVEPSSTHTAASIMPLSFGNAPFGILSPSNGPPGAASAAI